MEHFRILGYANVTPVVAMLPALERYWPRDTLRQSAPGSPHYDTESIYLRMPPVVDAETIFSSMAVQDWKPLPEPRLQALIDRVAELAERPAARVMLVRLAVGGVISPHIDQGEYADATHRYHVALTTNSRCVMHIGEEQLSARVGEVWFFDKHAIHAVVNNGPTARVHLIVDCWR